MTAQGGLKRSLGLWAIVGLGLGYMTPTVLFDTFGIVTKETDGVVPLAYLVALVVMLFTAVSYGRIAKAFPSAGSAYTYTREAIKHIALNIALPLIGMALTGVLWSFLHKDALIAGLAWTGLGLVYVYVLGRVTGRRVTDVSLHDSPVAEPAPTPATVPAPASEPAAVPAPMPVPALATA